MTRFQNGLFVLATDHSPPARRAAREGLALAEALGARVLLAHVVTPFHEGTEEARAALEAFTAELAPAIPVEQALERGISVEAGVFHLAKQHEAALLVVGTHGRTGLRHALVGSNAERLVQLAQRPVLCVRPPDDPEAPLHLSAPKRVLCPVDFSDAARRACDDALALALHWDAELLLVHVVEPVLVPEAYGLPASQVAVSLEQEVREAAESQLRALTAELSESGAKVRALIDEGNASHRLTELVSEEDVDLVVMATRGLTGLEHMLLGSTAERVVRRCACPVLAIK
ncbi:MAG: universal stress protein [Planctomycetota bacterium]|nr:MAG: universal stress protein [Planctomycetota bacterium]